MFYPLDPEQAVFSQSSSAARSVTIDDAQLYGELSFALFKREAAPCGQLCQAWRWPFMSADALHRCAGLPSANVARTSNDAPYVDRCTVVMPAGVA
ncbi:hypothetical protein GCM10025794_01780 [Massilia kyonggiensis]